MLQSTIPIQPIDTAVEYKIDCKGTGTGTVGCAYLVTYVLIISQNLSKVDLLLYP